MSLRDFSNILQMFTVFQIFLVCGFLLFQPKKNPAKNYLLILIISAKAFAVLDTLFIRNYAIVFKFVSNLMLFPTAFLWVIGPALYFYTIVLTKKPNYSFGKRDLLHLAPFLFHIGLMIFNFHIYGYDTKLQLLQNRFLASAAWYRYLSYVNYAHFVIYGVLALRILYIAPKEIYKYNSQSLDRNLLFIKIFIYDIIVVWSIHFLSYIIPLSRQLNLIIYFGSEINIFLIANVLVYQGLRFPEIFHGESSFSQKYEKNLLTEEERKNYSTKLLNYMVTQKPHLNPTLSLGDLASQLNMPSYALSQVLNVELNKNFYDFINLYRVEESKTLIQNASEKGKSILEILYESGFNSKSAFNIAFKKHTNTTPRQFKKLQMS